MAEENENSKQEVSTALELLISTLADERKRIYRVGADAMQAQDGDTALAVIGFAKKLEKFQAEVQTLNQNWQVLLDEREAASPAVQKIVDGEGRLFGTKTRKAASGFTRKVDHPIAAKSNFRVTFPDGTVIQKKTACDVFVSAIEHIGLARVRSLNLKSCSEPLISTEISKKYPRASKPTREGLYISTQSSTLQKVQYLNTIAKMLKIKFDVELLQPTAADESQPDLELSDTVTPEDFQKFLLEKMGLDPKTVKSYMSAIPGLAEWASEHFLLQVGVDLLNTAPDELKELQYSLTNNAKYLAWNQEKHNRYSAAFAKLLKFKGVE